jgi:hypothetical protein
MPQKPTRPQPEPTEESWNEFLTPEQRADAIAEILTTIALRIMKQRHEQSHEQDTKDLHI